MTIDQQRSAYQDLRNKIPHSWRQEWRFIEQAFKDLDVPPTPREWLAEITKFSKEVMSYESALNAWINLRLEEPNGWGENYCPSQIKGWCHTLDIKTKTHLLRRQFNEDLNTMLSYESWMQERT